MQKNSHYLRRVRRFAFYSIAAGIVLLAVMMSVLRVVVSGAESWRMELQQLGAYYLERPVVIKALDARLDGLVPVLVLKNVHIMSANGEERLFSFHEGTLGLDIFGSLRRQTFIPAEFTIQGAEITVIRHKDKRFSLKGIELKNSEEATSDDRNSNEFIDWLFQRTNLNVSNSTIIWIDRFREQAALRLDNVAIHLHNDGEHHQLKASLKLPQTLGRKFEFALDAWGRTTMNPADWRGKFYLRGDGIHTRQSGMIPAVEGYKILGGMTDFTLWGEWDKGQLGQLSGDVTVYNMEIQHPEFPQNLNIKLLAGLFDYQLVKDGWKLDVNRFHYMDEQGSWPQTDISIRQHRRPSSEHTLTEVRADNFRLENISSLLQRTAILSKEQSAMLESIQPSGDIKNFSVRFSEDFELPDISLQARFSQLGFSSWKKIPGMRGLSGDIHGSSGQMILDVRSDYAVFDFPSLFRQPLKISALSGIFSIQRYEQGWQVSTSSLLVKNEDIETNTSVLIDIPDNEISPFMDLQVGFEKANAAQAWRYYPVGIMSSELVNWLDRGIVSGQIVAGGAVFHGRLGDFPFSENEGQLRVEFEARDARIDYLAGWPDVHDAHFNAVFTERGMDIQADTGKIFDSALSATTIKIENFLRANLRINGEVNGTVKDALAFLVESPIQPQAKSLLDSFHYHGSSRIKLDLSIPLNDEVEKTQPLAVKGDVDIRDAELLMLDDLIDIRAINGNIHFTENSQSASGIRAQIMGGKANIDIRTENNNDGGTIVVEATGNIDSHHLTHKFGLPAWAQINGITDWRGTLSIPRSSQTKTIPVLTIRSQLQAVKVNLPPPLGKRSDELREAILKVYFEDDKQTRLYGSLKNHVSGGLLLSKPGESESSSLKPLKAYVHFGAGEGRLPETESLRLSGSLPMFSLRPWVDALKQGSDEVTGSFVSLPLVFDMEALQLAPVADETDSESTTAPPMKLDVDQFPLIRGTIKKLSYDDVPIGRIELHTSRLKLRKGIRVDSLSLQSEDINMQANGEWVQWPGWESSTMTLKLDSPDLGKMLSSLGFSAIVQGGKTTIDGTLYWPNSPMGMRLSEIKSKLKYTVEDGSIVSVEPGAGRLLGLFSLAALPRRLILDFSDAFGDGLHFDSIEGELNIHDGSAFMENSVMKSPLAQITIEGRTGLVDRDFDQLITVKPQGGDALTAVAGGMIFGPQIGAAILLVQKIIGNELQDVTATRYTVTGSWDEPVITQLDKPHVDESPSLEGDEF